MTTTNLSRLFVARFTFLLLLGCALLGFAPMTHAQQNQLPPHLLVPLTTDTMDKMALLIRAVGSDPAARAELKAGLDSVRNDSTMHNTLASGGSINEAFAAKCPRAAAAMKTVGMTPDTFCKSFLSLVLATLGSQGKIKANLNTPMDANTQEAVKVQMANIQFVNANKDRVDAVDSALRSL